MSPNNNQISYRTVPEKHGQSGKTCNRFAAYRLWFTSPATSRNCRIVASPLEYLVAIHLRGSRRGSYIDVSYKTPLPLNPLSDTDFWKRRCQLFINQRTLFKTYILYSQFHFVGCLIHKLQNLIKFSYLYAFRKIEWPLVVYFWGKNGRYFHPYFCPALFRLRPVPRTCPAGLSRPVTHPSGHSPSLVST